MASTREQIMQTLEWRLRTIPNVTVRRNEVLRQAVPPGGMIVLRDSEPGEPDMTLGTVSYWYTHRVDLEVFVPALFDGTAEGRLDTLLTYIGATLSVDESLGGRAQMMSWGAPDVSVVSMDGGPPILSALVAVVVEYQVSDPLQG